MFPPPRKNKLYRQQQVLDVKWVPCLPSIEPKEEGEKDHAHPHLVQWEGQQVTKRYSVLEEVLLSRYTALKGECRSQSLSRAFE